LAEKEIRSTSRIFGWYSWSILNVCKLLTFMLRVNAEKTKYMLLSRHQNAGQNQNIKVGDRSFENMGQFKYLGKTVIYQNLIGEKIKR
jgi:hypothetical protein